MKLFIDAGHGGKDGGASGNGVIEKAVNLTISNGITAYLTSHYDGVEIRATRTDDTYYSLQNRTDRANAWGADFFLSIHCNAATNSTANGFSSHVYTNANDRTRSVQNVIHKEILAQNVFNDRGQLKDDFHVLRETRMVSLLTENGFVSNLQDAAKLKQNSVIEKLIIGHARGIAKFFGLKERAGITEPVSGLFTDTVNHWAKDSIKKVANAGLMSGYDGGIFKPDQSLTRAEFAAVLAKLLDR